MGCNYSTATPSLSTSNRTCYSRVMNIPTPLCSKSEFELPLSHLAFERANKVIPGGVNIPARAFGAVGGEPPYIARAQ